MSAAFGPTFRGGQPTAVRRQKGVGSRVPSSELSTGFPRSSLLPIHEAPRGIPLLLCLASKFSTRASANSFLTEGVITTYLSCTGARTGVVPDCRSPERSMALARTTSGSRGSSGSTLCQERSRRTFGLSMRMRLTIPASASPDRSALLAHTDRRPSRASLGKGPAEGRYPRPDTALHGARRDALQLGHLCG